MVSMNPRNVIRCTPFDYLWIGYPLLTHNRFYGDETVLNQCQSLGNGSPQRFIKKELQSVRLQDALPIQAPLVFLSARGHTLP